MILLLSVIAIWYFLSWSQIPEVPKMLMPPTSLDQLVTEFPELDSILSDPRLDSVLKDFLMVYEEGGLEAAYDLALIRGILNKEDELILTLELDTTETALLRAELEAYGIIVIAVSGNLIDITVPMEIIQTSIESGNPASILENIAGLEQVRRIKIPIPFDGFKWLRLTLPSLEFIGSVESESLSMIGATNWQNAGYTGKGIKVGIIDPSDFARYKELLGTDLPAKVTARSFVYGTELDTEGDAHGTACAEIIHDIAPDADLYFASIQLRTELEAAVDWMMSQGVQIISYSAGRSIGPFDGSDPSSLLVDRVVESGILWVNASGNEADKHYRGIYHDEDGNRYHEFDGHEELLRLIVPPGQRTFILNWDDWQSGTQDFNLYLYDENGDLIASSENIQDGLGSEPYEFISYKIPSKGIYYVAFYSVNATRPVVFDFFVEGWVDTKYAVPEYSLSVPADARRALSVGAVNWADDTLEEFSSNGPTSDGRLKPELTAPDNVTSAAYGEVWDGTSAACPHVAGAAALVLQAFPSYTPDQVIQFLENRAIDLGPTGSENAYGHGRLWLGEGPASVTSPVPTEETLIPPLVPIATNQSVKTATPTRRKTATPSATDESELNLSFGILLCVAAPGLIGLGGIVLLGAVWRKSRSRPTLKARREFCPPTPDYPRRSPDLPVTPPVLSQSAPLKPELKPKPTKVNVCPRCGISHRAKARFCPVCGYVLSPENQPKEEISFCIYCGKELLPNSRFCTKCGKPRDG